jgi:hypothetical protein
LDDSGQLTPCPTATMRIAPACVATRSNNISRVAVAMGENVCTTMRGTTSHRNYEAATLLHTRMVQHNGSRHTTSKLCVAYTIGLKTASNFISHYAASPSPMNNARQIMIPHSSRKCWLGVSPASECFGARIMERPSTRPSSNASHLRSLVLEPTAYILITNAVARSYI